MTTKLILFLTVEYSTHLLSSNRLFQSIILILFISRLTLFSKMIVEFLGCYWKMYSLRQFKLLMLLRLHKFPCDDQWLWKDNIVGKATAKAAYKYFRMQTQQEVSNRKDQKAMQQIPVGPRVQNFRCALKKLHTADRLNRIDITIGIDCPLCNPNMESVDLCSKNLAICQQLV